MKILSLILTLMAIAMTATGQVSQIQSPQTITRTPKRTLTSLDIQNKAKEIQMQMETEMETEMMMRHGMHSKSALDIKEQIEKQLRQNACQNTGGRRKASARKEDLVEKLDSVVYRSWRCRYTYDLDRLLITAVYEDNWDKETGTYKPYSESTFEYDDDNNCVKYFNKFDTFGSGEVFEGIQDKDYVRKYYDWDEEKGEWYIHTQYVYRSYENGCHIESWFYDENKGLYLSEGHDYEYFEGITNPDGSRIVKTDTWYIDNPDEPCSKDEYRILSGTQYVSKGYARVGSEWVLTYNSYLTAPQTLYTEQYEIVDGQKKLYSTTRESHNGNYFQSDKICDYEYIAYDTSTGQINDGIKEEHLYNTGNEEVGYTRYDYYPYNGWQPTNKWIKIDNKIYNYDTYNYNTGDEEFICNDIPEGSTLYLQKLVGGHSRSNQIYKNGNWSEYYAYKYQFLYKNDNDSIPVSCGTKNVIYFVRDTDTGEYKIYQECYFTYDENYNLLADSTYSAPDSLSYRKEYSYNDEGQISEFRYYTYEGAEKKLNYKDVYVYDPDVLCSQTLGEKGVTNMNYTVNASYLSKPDATGHKLKSIERYDAEGNLLYSEETYHYSPLTDPTEVKAIEEEMPVQTSTPAKMFNLQGIQTQNPQSGQIIITDQNQKILIGK